MEKKNFILDSFKTITSTIIVAFSLQLFAYPTISNTLGSEDFGEILSIYTIITIVSVVIGNTLNNIRMINVSDFDGNFMYRRFLLILVMSFMVEIFILVFLFYYFYKIDKITIFCLLIINMLMILRIYLNVYFRLKLEFSKILIAAIFQVLGLAIGILLFKYFEYWVLIFLLSEVCIVSYTVYTLRYLKFKSESKEFKKKSILPDYLNLLVSNSLNNVNIYIDRIILLPIIGGGAVAISFLATFIGKIFATFMFPINNVILSYISVKNTNNKKRLYLIVNVYGFFLSVLIILVSYPTTLFIVEYFYHHNNSEIKPFIILGNIGVFLGVIATMIQSLNTKYISISKQTSYVTIHTILYIILSLILTGIYGLYGFFIITLIANVIKLSLLTYIGIKDCDTYTPFEGSRNNVSKY
ncbi:capsular biosynthesis protein [Staphylococcus hyicus]|uniref:capsular biosynthesis protein n=1 Tax=Staphylococcus hyicus TaxID=1284 RepID=UPI00208F3391|nr:capsular biosynthesis protein [Staphylococcus hyicus]MCO4329232.1 capsular biosynthesis protein [Staphylococcus hyicus]MCO4337009.1 capsular biosynthesis protein [Staphylococcus hyicus]